VNVTEEIGITNLDHLARTIVEKSSIKCSRQTALNLILNHLEHGVEIRKDGELAGYLLVFNVLGTRSLHGYKFVDGFGVRAFRLAKKIVKQFDIRCLTTTIDQLKVCRLAGLLGFNLQQKIGNYVAFERGAA